MSLTTTKTQTWANMKDLGASFYNKINSPEIQSRIEEMDAKLKAHEERIAKERELKNRAADIERLGGIRQYQDFTAATYTNKPVLKAMANFPKANYYLWGAAGVGKTHAAVAVIRLVKGARLVRMAQISRLFRKDISSEMEEKYLNYFSSIPLCLDDLGSEKMTDFLQGILFEIMDRRWSNKTGGLIITANMNIANLSRIIGDRTVSRIAGLVGVNNTLELSGSDHRLGMELR